VIKTIGFPKNICGGHMLNILAQIAQFGEIRNFKEKAVAEGIRRIYIRFK
jgi:alanyl-tRNA synthetase